MPSGASQRRASDAATQAPAPARMKAIRIHGRGGPERLVYEDAPGPRLGPEDALVRVHATGITPAELTWDSTYQNADGSKRIPSIPGHEVSGIVADLAPGVTGIQVGDAVYGLTDFPRDGAAAEFIAVRATNLAPKPRSLDHAQAAAVPLSGLTAWQALFDRGGLSAGQRVLIHGGAGGVGTFAVQFARWRGAYVIATTSAQNAEFLRDLGANELIDYAVERFEEKLRDVDLVLDTIGGETLERSWRVLRRGGLLVSLPAPIPADQPLRFGARGLFFIVEPDRAELMEIAALIDGGKLKPVVAEVLPLARAREAFQHGGAGHRPGKIVLKVRD